MSDPTIISTASNAFPQDVQENAATHLRGYSRRLIPVSAERLEELAAAHGRNYDLIGHGLGCAPITLRKKLAHEEVLRAAFERGLVRAGVAGRTPRQQQRRSRGRGARIVIDPARLEELTVERNGNKTRIALALRCSLPTLNNRLRDTPELRAAYLRGINPREAVEAAPVAAAVATPHTTLRNAPDADLLLDAIRNGRRTVGDILQFTGLTNTHFRRAVDVLEHTFQIKARYERNLQHFYLMTEVWAR